MSRVFRRRDVLNVSAAYAVLSHGVPAHAEAMGRLFKLRRGVSIDDIASFPEIHPLPDFPSALSVFNSRLSKLTAALLIEVRRSGFDFLRIPIEPALLLGTPATKLSATIRLEEMLDRIVGAGLRVIFDFHPAPSHPGYLPQDMFQLLEGAKPNSTENFFDAMVLAAQIVAKYPPGTCIFEPLNEPAAWTTLQRSSWPDLQFHLANRIWAENPTVSLVISGAAGHLIDLIAINPSGYIERPAYFTFHYYDPIVFTHQNATPDYRSRDRINWPLADCPAIALDHSTPEIFACKERAISKIKVDFGQVASWADRNNITRDRILLGEFGVARSDRNVLRAPQSSRLAWFRAVREAAEGFGFAWCIWGINAGAFSVGGAPGQFLEAGLVDPLGLRQ